MNFRLVGMMALFGLAMEFTALWVVLPKFVPLVTWTTIVATSVVVARSGPRHHFVFGALVGVINCGWMFLALTFFSKPFFARSPLTAGALQFGKKLFDHPEWLTLAGGTLALGFGLAYGFAAVLTSLVIKPGNSAPAPRPAAA